MTRLISAAISLGILTLLYWKIDFAKIVPVFARSSPSWLVISLGMTAPLTLATAWRLRKLLPSETSIGFLESNRLILLASVLNFVLPSKMGDMAKAAFIVERGHLKSSSAIALVVFEKACDLISLLVWCMFGLFLYPQKDALFWVATCAIAFGILGFGLLLGSRNFAGWVFGQTRLFLSQRWAAKVGALEESWNEIHGSVWQSKPRLATIAITSLGIWFLHLLQIWLFTLALRTPVSFVANLALSPLAILAGLLPLTFAGVGTRDAALVFLFSPYLPAPDAAALGVLCTMRYVLPALAGLPFIGRSLAALGGLTRLRTIRADA